MCSVITGLYRMKKRRLTDATVVSVSDPNIFRPKNGVAVNAQQQQQQRNHAFLNNASEDVNSSRTPRRSPRIKGGFSRTSGVGCGRADSSLQESPDSEEMLITWKCNSPVYAKSLRPISERDLQEIVGKFVPAPNINTQRSMSLLDIWLAPCDTLNLPTPVKTRYVKPTSKQSQVAKEMEELIEEVDRYRAQSVSSRETSSAPTTAAEKPESHDDEKRDVWEDDDLFQDEDVIALTQQAEVAFKTNNLNWNSKTDVPKVESATSSSDPTKPNKDLPKEDAREDGIVDVVCGGSSPDIITNLADDDSMLCRPTQVFVDETDRDASSSSPDPIDTGFVEEDGQVDRHDDTIVACNGASSGGDARVPISPNKKTVCRQEEILRKKEEALRRRSARLRDLRAKNATTNSVFSFMQTEGDASAQKRLEITDRIVPSKESTATINSQVSVCSQLRSQQEIQRNREEALKRRSARLANQATSKAVANAVGIGRQQNQAAAATEEHRRQLCSLSEIERKKREAMERRRKKLMTAASGS